MLRYDRMIDRLSLV